MLGLFVLVVILAVSNLLHLLVLATVMQYLLLGTAVGLPIVFQPELRRGLEQLGRGRLFVRDRRAEDEIAAEQIRIVAHAGVPAGAPARRRADRDRAANRAARVRRERHGAGRAALARACSTAIFNKTSPLHDGAVIVRDLHVEGAACFLPLSENTSPSGVMTQIEKALPAISTLQPDMQDQAIEAVYQLHRRAVRDPPHPQRTARQPATIRDRQPELGRASRDAAAPARRLRHGDSGSNTVQETSMTELRFPAVMCEPPDEHIGNMPSERFYFLGVSTKGGQWEADDLPMHLHLFAHIAGAAIRKWWTSLASAAVSDDRQGDGRQNRTLIRLTRVGS